MVAGFSPSSPPLKPFDKEAVALVEFEEPDPFKELGESIRKRSGTVAHRATPNEARRMDMALFRRALALDLSVANGRNNEASRTHALVALDKYVSDKNMTTAEIRQKMLATRMTHTH